MYSWIHIKKFILEGNNKNSFPFIQMYDNVVYVKPCFLTLMGSKTNSSSDNSWKWWMVLHVASWIGN